MFAVVVSIARLNINIVVISQAIPINNKNKTNKAKKNKQVFCIICVNLFYLASQTLLFSLNFHKNLTKIPRKMQIISARVAQQKLTQMLAYVYTQAMIFSLSLSRMSRLEFHCNLIASYFKLLLASAIIYKKKEQPSIINATERRFFVHSMFYLVFYSRNITTTKIYIYF